MATEAKRDEALQQNKHNANQDSLDNEDSSISPL